jgi:heptosyltransferase-1
MAAVLGHDARVLIVRMGALGDIVHALPVLAALRTHRPDVRVDWLVDARYAGVLGLVDGLARLVVVRATDDAVDHRVARFAGVAGMGRALAFLRRQAYAAAIDLQGSSSRRSSPVARARPAYSGSSAARCASRRRPSATASRWRWTIAGTSCTRTWRCSPRSACPRPA